MSINTEGMPASAVDAIFDATKNDVRRYADLDGQCELGVEGARVALDSLNGLLEYRATSVFSDHSEPQKDLTIEEIDTSISKIEDLIKTHGIQRGES